MMATSIATNVYNARNGVGGVSLAGSNFATGVTRPRPRTTPRIGGPAAKHASGTISYLQPDPLGQFGDYALYRYAENKPLLAIDPEGLNVQVNDYNAGGTGRSRFPHVGMWISTYANDDCCKPNGREWWDLTPSASTLPKIMLPNPGVISNGYPGGTPKATVYCTTCEQDKKARAAAQTMLATGVTYSWCNIGGMNCGGFVDAVLSAAGITEADKCGSFTVPDPGSPAPPLGEIFPDE